jgi:hypothetical protein
MILKILFFPRLKYVFISSNPSPINIHAFCGQTYDRSTSAYTSKKRSHRHYTKIRDEIDQSTSASILSRVDENGISSNTIKHQNNYVDKSSKYKYYSTQTNPSNLSDIYIKLSDCQAACRLVKIRHERDQSFSVPVPVPVPVKKNFGPGPGQKKKFWPRSRPDPGQKKKFGPGTTLLISS